MPRKPESGSPESTYLFKAYSRPVTAVLLRLLGGLVIGVACLGFFVALGNHEGSQTGTNLAACLGAGISGLLLIGVGEVIDLLARTAHNTQETGNLIKHEGQQIRQLFATPTTLAAHSHAAESRFFYAEANGRPIGPHTKAELKQMVSNGSLDAESYVCQEGGSDWFKLGKMIAIL